MKGTVILFSSRITRHFYSWKLWSVVFHCTDSVLHGTQGQLSWLKLGIGKNTLQMFLPKHKIEINFRVFPTDAGGVLCCCFVSFISWLSLMQLLVLETFSAQNQHWKLRRAVPLCLVRNLTWLSPLLAWFLDMGYDSVHGTLNRLL